MLLALTIKATEPDCHKKVFHFPDTHWLLQETEKQQKKIILYLSRVTTYRCYRSVYAEQLLSGLEESAKTGNREPVDLTISLLSELYPKDAEKQELVNIYGEQKIIKL